MDAPEDMDTSENTGAARKERSPEQKMASDLAKALWQARSATGKGEPKMSAEERKAAWKAAKPEMTRTARKALKSLTESGWVITPKA